MARRAKEPDLEVDKKELQITEALDTKRRQLDQEIADFKAEKEHEYRFFERQLRGKSKENCVQHAPQSQRKRGRSKPKTAAAEADLAQKEMAIHGQRESDDENPGQKGPAPEKKFLMSITRSRTSPRGSPGPADRPIEALHERERESRELFTPNYLMGGTPTDEGSRSKKLLHPRFFSSGDLPAARQNNGTMLSSSAETVHPPMTSPTLPPTRPLSSSVPPEKPSHHRRDSSRSDTSIASLRSSLRDPRQPRSPKRVLFSIDDTLVSPSTSPIAQRSKPTTSTKLVNSLDTTAGVEKFQVVRNQDGNGSAVNRTQSNGVGFSSSNVPTNGWATSLSTFGRAVQSNISKPSASAGRADDFENLESDDLFTFDEDMGWAGKNNPQETDPEDEYDEDVEVDEKKSEDLLTASSPHAGSLPIEIKWPGRREGRG